MARTRERLGVAAVTAALALGAVACSGGGRELTGPPSGQEDDVPADAPTGLYVEGEDEPEPSQGPLLQPGS
ncbi:hypothetical protein [Euzebya sp.]|uniref:hypothetical protein n=1 Tax=Euzebya sp. TaxID=1971409 RepID=UPI0035170C74